MSEPPYPYDPYQQPYHQQPGWGQQPMQVAPKNPAVSLLISFFIPGVGSMVNGDVGKGILILLGYLISFPLVFILIGFLGIFGFWIWGMVDAYKGAQKWNLRHGIIS